MNYIELSRLLRSPEGMARLSSTYGRQEGVLVQQMGRFGGLIKMHEDIFHANDQNLSVISSPGRSEIIGNHTDHNNGKVLAAAVNLDTLAAVTKRDDMLVIVVSEGYPPFKVDLRTLVPRDTEQGTSSALIRGVAQRMQQLGLAIGGFSAAVTSDVLGGSGLSSSAAFEVMICCIQDVLYNAGNMDKVLRAKICQYAENVHFGKPSGLMDQMASSVGGMIGIDFKEDEPLIETLQFSFQQAGLALVVVGTGGSHDDLTADYAAIRQEMHAVASFLGGSVLRNLRPEQLYLNLRPLRASVGDRAVLRAIHYFNENARVSRALCALKESDTTAFLEQIKASGHSSWELLQNTYASPRDQALALALALAQELLQGEGACRLHGGGFAGTTLNFVPLAKVEYFVKGMSAVFGPKCCMVLDVRREGACQVF